MTTRSPYSDLEILIMLSPSRDWANTHGSTQRANTKFHWYVWYDDICTGAVRVVLWIITSWADLTKQCTAAHTS